MANVPGVLLIGDPMVQGGNPGVEADFTGSGTTALAKFFDLRVMRITPSSDATGAPTAASLGWYPWYDAGAQSTYYAVAAAPAPSATTISVSPSPGWTVNQWAGKPVSVVNVSTIGFMQRRLVVSNTADTITVASWSAGTPAAGQIFFLGQGRWKDYHPAAGYLDPSEVGVVFSNRGGSSLDALGLGVGPDAGLIREFQTTWPVAPRFQLAKYGTTSLTVGAWGTAASGIRTAFTTRLAEMATAWTALANGNTLVWEVAILDASQRDVIDWATTPANYLLYEAALTSWIAWLRTATGNANLKIILVNHDNAINNVTTPSGTLSANRVHRSVAAADALVTFIDMQGERTSGTTQYAVEAENRPAYAASVYWSSMATKMREAYDLLAAGAPSAIDAALPGYFLIGDSHVVGSFNSAYTDALGSPTITSGPRSGTQGIYDDQNDLIEPYDVGDNSNTSGTISTSAGPECSMMVDLEVLHPQKFVLIKRGSNSSSLIANLSAYSSGTGGRWSRSYAATEHWDQLQAAFEGCIAYAHTTLSKQLDLKGVFVMLGTNDGAKAGGGALFAAELATFVADLRSSFATRTSGTDFPVVWVKPQLDYATAINAEIVAVRAALEAYALTDDQFVLLNIDDLERLASDNIHLTPESTIKVGQRMVAALIPVAI